MFKLKTPLLTKQKNHTSSLPNSLRSDVGEAIYERAKKAGFTKPLHEEHRLREWQYWAIIENAFPYDMAFKVHHMLIPKRVANRKQLNDAEKLELEAIMDELNELYDCQLTNFTSKQSIPSHFHIHLLIYKDFRDEHSF